MSKISKKVIHSKDRYFSGRVIERCDRDRQCTPIPNRVNVFGTGMTLLGLADVRQAVARPCSLQLCVVLGSSGIKLSEWICRFDLK